MLEREREREREMTRVCERKRERECVCFMQESERESERAKRVMLYLNRVTANFMLCVLLLPSPLLSFVSERDREKEFKRYFLLSCKT